MKKHRGGRRSPYLAAGALVPALVLLTPMLAPASLGHGAQAQDPPPRPEDPSPRANECPCPSFFFEGWSGQPGMRFDELFDREGGLWRFPEELRHDLEGLRHEFEGLRFHFESPGFQADTVRGRVLVPAIERVLLGPAQGRFGLRLHDLGEELGRYFGRSEGALVLEVRDDAAVDLRAGDVITTIDGREVENASHAARILQSYRSGEELTIEVWREGRAVRVEATAP